MYCNVQLLPYVFVIYDTLSVLCTLSSAPVMYTCGREHVMHTCGCAPVRRYKILGEYTTLNGNKIKVIVSYIHVYMVMNQCLKDKNSRVQRKLFLNFRKCRKELLLMWKHRQDLRKCFYRRDLVLRAIEIDLLPMSFRIISLDSPFQIHRVVIHLNKSLATGKTMLSTWWFQEIRLHVVKCLLRVYGNINGTIKRTLHYEFNLGKYCNFLFSVQLNESYGCSWTHIGKHKYYGTHLKSPTASFEHCQHNSTETSQSLRSSRPQNTKRHQGLIHRAPKITSQTKMLGWALFSMPLGKQ